MYVLCVLDRLLYMNNVLPMNAIDNQTDDNHVPAAYEEQSMICCGGVTLAAEGLDAPAGGGDGNGDGDGPNSNRRRAALVIRSLTPVVTGVGERSRHQLRKLASGIDAGNGDAEASRCNTSTGGAPVVAGDGDGEGSRVNTRNTSMVLQLQ